MKIIEILDQLKQMPETYLTNGIQTNILKIRKICEEKYNAKKTFGEDALNRMILLDNEIAELLTPEVIQFLFTKKGEIPKSQKVLRDDGNRRDMRDVIYYGFINGLLPIKFLPNNEPSYGLKQYQQKQKNYEENTLKIVRNIAQSAGVNLLKIEPLDETRLYNNSLTDQFEVITATINTIAQHKPSSIELIKVKMFSPEAILSQAKAGFNHLYEPVIEKLKRANQEINLNNFCEAFLNDPALIFNEDIGHFLLDRVHMEATILSNEELDIGDESYTYQEIFQRIVQKISDEPDKYPEYVKQQLFLRFSIVENDLRQRFQKQFLNNYYIQGYIRADEPQQQEIVKYFAGMILSSKDEELQKLLKSNNSELYDTVGSELKKIYEEHVQVLTNHRNTLARRVLKTEIDSFWADPDLELITDENKKIVEKSILDGKMTSFFSPNYDSPTELNELILHANILNAALISADRIQGPQSLIEDSVDDLTLYRNKMIAMKNSLETKPIKGNEITGFDILKRDTSSDYSKFKQFIANILNLLSPKYFPYQQHKGHDVEKGFAQISEKMERFKEIKLQLKQVTETEDKDDSQKFNYKTN